MTRMTAFEARLLSDKGRAYVNFIDYTLRQVRHAAESGGSEVLVSDPWIYEVWEDGHRVSAMGYLVRRHLKQLGYEVEWVKANPDNPYPAFIVSW